MNFDAQIIMAYVDGELDLVTAKRIEKAMESDLALSARVDAERRLRQLLSARFDQITTEEIPEQLSAVLTNVDTSLAGRRETKANRFGFGPAQWAAVAASLAIGLVLGQTSDRHTGQVTSDNGALVAQAGLKDSLDTQLASAQSPDAPVRIGLTFRDKSGAICRTFESEPFAGLACRQGEDWQLRQTVSETSQSAAYRQANSAAIAEAAAAIMAGDAFDADAERNAKTSGWKQAYRP